VALKSFFFHFYRVMLCYCHISCRRLSVWHVCPSVCYIPVLCHNG